MVSEAQIRKDELEVTKIVNVLSLEWYLNGTIRLYQRLACNLKV